MIPPPRDTHTHKHRFSLYFKSYLGKAKRDQTFEKLMQALSSQRFGGLRSRFLLSGALRIKDVLSDFNSLSQNHSHHCTTSGINIILYYKLSQDNLFAAALKNCRLLLPARKVLAPLELFSQARHLFPNTDGPCKAGVGGIRIRCRWNCSSCLKAYAAQEKKKKSLSILATFSSLFLKTTRHRLHTVSFHSTSSVDPECQLGPANHVQGIMGLTAEAILHSEKDFFPERFV